ncbi:MAG: HAD family phosphatase [Myxococcales bacterium]|nr:HAD family phosphatase [Myxococcales bacterium]
MRTQLLALDLDGTLLGHDNTLREVDVRAIAAARAAGIAVTLATGRLAAGALPTARALGLSTPLVCSDGAVVIESPSGEVVYQHYLEARLIEEVTHALGDHALHAFWFSHDEIVGEEGAGALRSFVETWSPRLTFHPRLIGSSAWETRHTVSMAAGIGPREGVERIVEQLVVRHGKAVQVATFPAWRSDQWTVLIRSAHVDKATGLSQVAQRLGITAREVAVVGDWHNDVPMFRWAGRSFAMGQSSPEVAQHATDRLSTDHRQGGGVAEAIARLLAG